MTHETGKSWDLQAAELYLLTCLIAPICYHMITKTHLSLQCSTCGFHASSFSSQDKESHL